MADSIVDGVDALLGMDVIDRSGVLVCRFKVQFRIQLGVRYGEGQCLPVLAATKTVPVKDSCQKQGEGLCSIEDKNVKNDFDGEYWTVE